MCADEERFVHWKLYQTLLPCICFQRSIDAIAWCDAKLGCPLQKCLRVCERRWFRGWDEIHHMRLDQPEEDQALFLFAFASEAIFILFPFVEELWDVGFPDALSVRNRRRLMAYYRSCLQRHVYANGQGRTLLVKSTHASGAIESISEAFPDARFITIVRHPYESIASHVSLFVPAWQTHSLDIDKDGAESHAYAGLAIEWYRHLYRFSATMPPERFYRIKFAQLARDPGQAVAGIFQHFGWRLSGAFAEKLREVSERQRSFQSRHSYSLEEFGLSREWIRAELGPLLEAYELAP